MKNKLFLLIMLSLTVQSCGQTIPDKKEDEIDKMLKTFYASYIRECDKIPIDFDKIKALKKRYLTDELLVEIEESELDYDPIIDAQDVNTDWLNTLTVSSSDEENTYNVCYSDESINKKKCLRLLVVKSEEGYQINKIISLP